MIKFTDFALAAPLQLALTAAAHVTPTPIQIQAIPPALEGRDVLGIAQTGTGKTAAFALPILHKLATDKRRPPRSGCRVLVLCPTRELASQIAASFRTYGGGLGLTVQTVFGGVPYGAQIRALQRGLDVLVATPGRLMDHIASGNAKLAETEFLVLDEVDQMLDLGFIHSIRKVVSMLPATRQNLFFSATMAPEIAKLAADLLTDPVRVSVTPVATTAERVNQRVLLLEPRRKRDVLVSLFDDAVMARSLVFTRTKRGADAVASFLDGAGIRADAIHGNKSQGQRERALAAFRQGRLRVLVATDIAARGIDIDGVSHVVNYDLPEVPESYVHRIGRTARAGADGEAIALCTPEDRDLLRAIEKTTRQQLPLEDLRENKSEPFSTASAGPDANGARRRKPQGGRPSQPQRRRPGGSPGGHAQGRGQAQKSGGSRQHY